MSRLSRRSFLAASAAAVAAPAFAEPLPADVDVAIIGAGAAGIAAARRIAAAKQKFILIEASDRVGGRCITDTGIFGVPYDLGAHWIHMPEMNPLAKLASAAKVDVYAAPRGQSLRVGPRPARDAETEAFLAAQVRSHRAIADAARGKADVPASQALPKDLGNWRASIEFVLGAYGCAKDLKDVSAVDFAHSAERDIDAFCRQGFGTLLASLAIGLPVSFATPVTRIDWASGISIETPQGRVRARTAIITVSTNMLTSGKIAFNPALPKRQLDAAAQLSLGSYDHIALELPGNPLGLQRDDLVFEKAEGPRTAAMLANVGGSSLHMIEVAGDFGRELSVAGKDAMTVFALDWLGSLFGNSVKNAVKRTHATRWNEEPWALGAFSCAAPGGADARKILAEPLGGKIWLAGEALHETLWGTAGGAWESGTRAAEAALRRMGVLREPLAQEPRRRLRGNDE